jgi:hypothetical protein
MSARIAPAARLLGECPFPSEPEPEDDASTAAWRSRLHSHADLRPGFRHDDQLRRDGWMQAQGTIAARIEDAGLIRGRMAVSLLEDGWAAVVLWALAWIALATLAALAGRPLGVG